MRVLNYVFKYSPIYLVLVSVGAHAMNCSGTSDITCTETNYNSGSMYSKYNYAGDLKLSFTDSVISAPGMAIIEGTSTTGESSFQANNLTTSNGGISISGGGIDVVLDNSAIGAGSDYSALSLSQASINLDTDVYVNSSALNGSTVINDAAGNIDFTANNSEFYGEIHVHETNNVTGADNNKSTSVSISDSAIDTTGVTHSSDNYPVYVESDRGTVNVLLDNDTITQTGSHNDVTVSSGTGIDTGSDVSVDVENSSLTNGIGASTTNPNSSSTITVKNSAIAQNTPSWNTAILASNGVTDGDFTGSGSSTIYIEDSKVNGNVAAENLGGGASNVLISGNSVVTGQITTFGTENSVTIADSTLNGDIAFGANNDEASVNASNTVTITDANYGGDIRAVDENATDDLTINVDNGGVMGGDSLDKAMQITGFENINVNINYLDPSLINSNKAKYFYFDNNEAVSVDNGMTGVLSPIRSGSYIKDNVKYVVTDESTDQSSAPDGSTYAVTFNADAPPAPDDDVVSDIQAAQAGLVASDDMIHLVADDITRHLDMPSRGNNIWVSGLYASSDRDAAQTKYQNKTTGAQFGGYLNFELQNGDRLIIGAANGYLRNSLDLRNRDGHNTINGSYYSAYVRWEQSQRVREPQWFADILQAYGDMSYSVYGNDAGIRGSGSYDGNSWLTQGRLGTTFTVGRFQLQPYTTVGYVNVQTDDFYDGYTHIGKGKQTDYFAGGGLRVATNLEMRGVKYIQPYMTMGYRSQFGGSTKLTTDDYSFAGETLDGGNVGAGSLIVFNQHWSGKAQVETEFGHAIDNALEANIMMSYQF